MARPLRIEYPGAFYHVTARGNERKVVYKSQRDREKFLEYLQSASARYNALVHVYCLMDNHYHLLIETPSGNLSQIMHHINGAYTTYFNTKHARSGHLFQGRYKAILIDADEYAKELSRYIHLNPVRTLIAKTAEEYNWSSCQYYCGKSKSPEWLQLDFILGYFGKKPRIAMNKYRYFVRLAMDQEYKNPLSRVVHSVIMGNKEFIAEITNRVLSEKQPDRDLPALKSLANKPELDHIKKTVDSVLQTEKKLARQVTLYLCHRHSGQKLKKIGQRFGIGESGVTQASQRINTKARKDNKLRKIIKLLEEKIFLSNV
jgi:REP element-mobilizing transposase RayT